MTPELWHRVLSAEPSPSKTRALHEALGSSRDWDLETLIPLPFWSESDRIRLRQADLVEFQRFEVQGVRLLGGPELPRRVQAMPVPPLALYAWGEAEALDRPTIGIVGTRRATGYGRAVAFRFAQTFAQAGVTVVSGGALGIDAQAHLGTLEAGGCTAAVLITGIESVYPKNHGGLFQRIRESRGCLVSQFALGTKSAWEFRPIARNQIIAALVDALVVIEAPIKSGSLSTAGFAAELGKPVFVVPGPIDQLGFQGSHLLIREGAQLVDHPHQVLEAIGVEPGTEGTRTPELSALANRILAALSTEPIAPEKLAITLAMDQAELLSELTDMELDGVVVRVDGKFAKRMGG